MLYFQYIRSLRFEDKADYAFLRRLFRDLFAKEGYSWDYVFDWTMLKYQRAQNSSSSSQQAHRAQPTPVPRTADQAGPSHARAHHDGHAPVQPAAAAQAPLANTSEARTARALEDARRQQQAQNLQQLDGAGGKGSQSRVRRTLAFFTRN